MKRAGELDGLADILAGLLEGNLASDSDRARLLAGPARQVVISAVDLDRHVSLELGDGQVVVEDGNRPDADLRVLADSGVLLEIPMAGLLWGMPSILDPGGRRVMAALATRRLRLKGILKVGLLRRVTKLLTVR